MTAQMWFGTEKRMQWVPAPAPGADLSPTHRSTSGTLINGGGWASSSFGSHGGAAFSWGAGSSTDAAQLMQAYQDGSHGRGLIYYIDPHAYTRNIFPKHWADPSMALDFEAPALRRDRGVTLAGDDTPDADINNLPVRSAVYAFDTLATFGYPGETESLYIPIPPGHRLALMAHYSATKDAGVYAAPVSATGELGEAVKLTPRDTADPDRFPELVPTGARGIRVWVGATAPGSVTLSGLVARIAPLPSIILIGYGEGPYGEWGYGGIVSYPDYISNRWVPGMGTTGCRFESSTYMPNTGVHGGQSSYSIKLKEVGAWLY